MLGWTHLTGKTRKQSEMTYRTALVRPAAQLAALRTISGAVFAVFPLRVAARKPVRLCSKRETAIKMLPKNPLKQY